MDRSRQAAWQEVLAAELKRWSTQSYAELVSSLHDVQAYEVERGPQKYQVEVELLEQTDDYVHIAVAVDDGTLPASLSPLTHTFIRKKG